MGLIVRTNTCAVCKYRELDPVNTQNGQPLYTCHRYPPAQTHIGVPVAVGQDPASGKQMTKIEARRFADHVIVVGTDWCGEWAPFLEKAH